MLRKMLAFLFSLTLLLPCAAAEEAIENPFVGAWEPLYYIQGGRPLTPEENEENPVMFTFTEDRIEYLMCDGSIESTSYSWEGTSCTADAVTYTLEHEDLIVGYYESLSFLLVRIDPIMLNNPFIGTWEALCYKEGDTVQAVAEYAMQAGLAADPADVQIPVVFAADAVHLLSSDAYPCTYADGACTIYQDGEAVAICTISEDGLLHIVNPQDETMEIICAREDEVVPEEISRFFGAWKDVAILTDAGIYTDRTPAAFRGENAPLFFTYDFTRAYVREDNLDIELDYEFPPILCSYTGGQCVIHYGNGDAVCSIDGNGLMTIHFPDGVTSWCIRVEEKPDEILSASARGLLSDVTVTITRTGDGVMTAITVDASGETEAIARPCTEEAFLSQFIGRTGPFTDIDVVAGATYTSNAVIDAVNSLYAAE